jgi:parallel beta-helix repeat protein
MRRAPRLLRSIATATALLAGTAGGGAVHAATFRVTTAHDSHGRTLRQAILDANANPGPDSIVFAIPGSGVQTITLRTPLPPVTDQVFIDGSSQGKPSRHLVVIDGVFGLGWYGLEVQGRGSWLHHLVLQHFYGGAILLAGGGLHAVTDCRVGTDAEGLVEVPNVYGGAPNGTGVFVESSGNVISGNLISLSGGDGVAVRYAERNLIERNLLGSNRDGLPFAPLGFAGSFWSVRLENSRQNEIWHNRIGGPWGGIGLFTSDDNIVSGNSIGIDSQGGALGTLRWGLFLDYGSSNNLIGDFAPGEANVIAHLGVGFLDLPGDAICHVGGGHGNRVRGNLMFDLDPGALVIDLGVDGPDANDWGDMDTGANDLQNAPVIVDAWQLPPPFVSSLIVRGELFTRLHSSITYAIDIYATTAESSPGVCEARRYLGSGSVSAGYNGIATFSLLLNATLDPGAMVSATATVDTPGQPADTSELSPCVTVQ